MKKKNKNFMHKQKQEIDDVEKDNGYRDDEENNEDNEFRSLYLDKEKKREYIFNPHKESDFAEQSEFQGSESGYSAHWSKDHVNKFNEELEQNIFQKIANIFLAQRILNLLTNLLAKLTSLIDTISPALLGKRRTRYKLVSALLKLLIKMQLNTILRLMQALILVNQKLFGFEENRFIGGQGQAQERERKMQRESDGARSRDRDDRERGREYRRTLEIGNREEMRRSEYLREKSHNPNRETVMSDSWKKYQDISIPLKKVEVNTEQSQSVSYEKGFMRRSEELVKRYIFGQEYANLSVSAGPQMQNSIFSQLLHLAKVVYNKAVDMYQSHFNQYNQVNLRDLNRNNYDVKAEYGHGKTYDNNRNSGQEYDFGNRGNHRNQGHGGERHNIDFGGIEGVGAPDIIKISGKPVVVDIQVNKDMGGFK